MEGYKIVPSDTLPEGLLPTAVFVSDFKVNGKNAVRVKACVAYAGGCMNESGFLLQKKVTDEYFLLVPCPSGGEATLPIWSQGDGEQKETCIIMPVRAFVDVDQE